jgi:hypothetical protein
MVRQSPRGPVHFFVVSQDHLSSAPHIQSRPPGGLYVLKRFEPGAGETTPLNPPDLLSIGNKI